METTHKKNFSMLARMKSFRHALRGLHVFVQKTHNSWVEIFIGIVLFASGVHFSISEGEWFALIGSIFMLIMAEAFNTAIEVHMDLTSPELHPAAKDTKDIAAGAVLIAAMLVCIITIIIFVPHIVNLDTVLSRV